MGLREEVQAEREDEGKRLYELWRGDGGHWERLTPVSRKRWVEFATKVKAAISVARILKEDEDGTTQT